MKRKNVISGLLAIVMMLSFSVPAFASETTVRGTNATSIIISDVVSQRNYSYNNETKIVYTVPIGANVTCHKDNGTVSNLDYAVFPDLSSLSNGSSDGGRVNSSFTIPSSMSGKVIIFWNATDTESITCEVSSQKVNDTTITPNNTVKPTSATYKTDTGTKLNLQANASYTFKITSLNGKKPTFVIGGKSFKTTLIGNKGKDYFFKVTMEKEHQARSSK